MVETGTLAELRHLTRTSIHAELDSVPDGPDRAARRARRCDVQGNRVQLRAWTPPKLGEVLERLTAHGVRSLTSQPPTLEELFLRHYQDEISASHGKHAAEVTVR